MRRYQLENRYQDDQWEKINEGYDNLDDATKIAYAKTGDAIAYGMVRVVDTKTNRVVAEYGAGQANWDKRNAPEVRGIAPPEPPVYVAQPVLVGEDDGEEIVGYLLAWVVEGSSCYRFDFIDGGEGSFYGNAGTDNEERQYKFKNDFEHATLKLKMMMAGKYYKIGQRVIDGYIKPIRARRQYEQVVEK